MIQDIAPHVLNNQFRTDIEAGDKDYLFIFVGGQLLVKRLPDESYMVPTFGMFKEEDSSIDVYPCTYLFSLDDVNAFLLEDYKVIPEGYAHWEIKTLRRQQILPRHLIFAAVTAFHLSHWYEYNRFCGHCGSTLRKSDTERALVCDRCRHTVYPRIVPAVIVAVTDGDRLLLTKYARRPDVTFYALVAGFTEIGETMEETVEREVMEEVGLKVKNIRYYKSQPWGFVDNLMIGFFCDVDGSREIHMDTSELKEAVWLNRDEIEGQPDDLALTNEMMMLFKAGKEPKV